jgi:hypothetical protein
VLVLVLGMLWVAASADALTMRDGLVPSLEPRLPLVDRIEEDYAGVLRAYPGDPIGVYARRPSNYTLLGVPPSYQLRGFMPRSFPTYSRLRAFERAGGNARFGRRDFIFHTGLPSLPNYYLPGRRGLFWNPSGNLLLRRDLAELSWRRLRGLVAALRLEPIIPIARLGDRRWGGVTMRIIGPDAFLPDENGGAVLRMQPGPGAVLRMQPEPVSVASNSAIVPEPATGALLLAGLCALAARRRRC